MEGLKRRGAPGAAINGQDVQLHVRGSWMQLRWRLCVLKMSGMQRLSSKRDAQAVVFSRAAEGVQQVSTPRPHMSCDNSGAATILGDPLDHHGISQTDHPVLPLQLEPLSLSETAGIPRVHPEPSEHVRTLMSTCPCSLSTLLTQEAVSETPPSFFVTW